MLTLPYVTAETDLHVRLIERVLTVLDETPAVYPEWRRLVVSHSVMGVQVHDARIVAVMNVHGVTHILTLNGADFTRYAGITCVAPDHV